MAEDAVPWSLSTRGLEEIAVKVGNSKKVVIGQTRRFGQVWVEMEVLFLCIFVVVVIFHLAFHFLVLSSFVYSLMRCRC